MQRRGMLLFVVLNILISAGVALTVFNTLGEEDDGGGTERLVTFEVIITATRDPNQTPEVRIITATPLPGEPERATIPDAVRDGTTSAAVPTLDPNAFNDEGVFEGDAASLPEGCIQHVIDEGEFPSVIAEIYDISMFDLLAVNGLDEESSRFLQIGDVLIVPLEGCPIDAFVEANGGTSASTTGAEDGDTDTEDGAGGEVDTAEETPEVTVIPTETVIPTVTLAPTAVNAQVEILEVMGAGDITAETVVIRNNGNTVNISGWTLSDGDGNTYSFPQDRSLFSGAAVEVKTREGANTAILFYWGRDTAVFGPGDVVVLANRDGEVQASLRLPAGP